MKLTPSTTSLMILFASLNLLAGCTQTTEDDAASDESDVKKKIKPDGGVSSALTTFELTKPTWLNKANFTGSYAFRNAGMAPGDKQEFDVRVGGDAITGNFILDNNYNGTLISEFIGIAPGTKVVRKPSAIYIHFAEPLTDRRADWQLDAQVPGDAWFVAPGQHAIATRYELNPIAANVIEGKLTEIVRPVTHIQIKLDAYDPSYPGIGDTYAFTEASWTPLRKSDGSPLYTDYVVPHSAQFPIELYRLNGGSVPLLTKPTVENGTIKIVFNRLEIDDMEVTINGVKHMQQGEASIYLGTTLDRRIATLPTHSGIDLPNGTYTVVSQTRTPLGDVTHRETVSFP